MEKLPQKAQQQLIQIVTRENWLHAWEELPVRANSSIAEVRSRYKTDSMAVIFVGNGGTKENAYTVFEMMLVGLFEFYGASYRPKAIRELAVMIYDQYYWLELSEIKHFFLRAKNGEYSGKSFAELKPQFVMQWFADYAAESLDAREAATLAAHDKLKYNDEKERLPDDVIRKGKVQSLRDAMNEQFKRENDGTV